MTVAELIAVLQRHDPALPVVVAGFDESGFDGLGTIEVVELVPIKPASHGPDYEKPEDIRPQWQEITGELFRALYLDC